MLTLTELETPKLAAGAELTRDPVWRAGRQEEGAEPRALFFSHKPRDPEEVPLGWVTWSSPREEERLRLALGLQHFYFPICTFSARGNATAALCFTRLDRGRGGTHEERRRPCE
ncbi:hypothetical protein AOLI_G00198750 [Acnodon oligacanthus]